MSYDIYLRVDAGGPEPVEAYWRNYTSNCSGMWDMASPVTDGLRGLHGMTADDAARHLTEMIRKMCRNPEPYRAMQPDNGWGDFDSQLDMLQEFRDRCERYPLAKVHISR